MQISASAPSGRSPARRQRPAWHFQRRLPLYLMLLPAAVGLFLFSYLPMLGLVMAFQNYKPLLGFFKSNFVGLNNFTRAFALPGFWDLVRNTLVIASGKVILGQMISLVFALLLHEITRPLFKRSVQTITYALYFLSWIVFGGLMLEVLGADGLFNHLLALVHIPTVEFLTDARIFPGTLIGTDIWKNFGTGAVLYLAALADVDVQLYEAAAIDGASRWSRMWNVTLPGIAPTIVVLACLSLGGLVDAGLQQILVLYNPVVYSTGDVISTFVYRVGLTSNQFSLGAAVGLMQSAVGLILISSSYYLARRFANYRVF